MQTVQSLIEHKVVSWVEEAVSNVQNKSKFIYSKICF